MGPRWRAADLEKGAGCRSHQSDVICSTYGWLENAGVQLEYGKNYEGYWTGEMFVEQVRLFLKIPTSLVQMLTTLEA